MIEILLAVHNGGKYLRELVESILAQSFPDWRLIARDDGSSDASPAILAELASRHPDRIVVARDARGRLGACGNFGALLEMTTAEYVMFADQDDVWLPEKVGVCHDRIMRLEAERTKATPLLVHTDLTVVDEKLHPLGASYMRYQSLDPRRKFLREVLMENNIIGCATIINKALRDLACPVPPEARMHDWWLLLVCTAFGAVEFVDASTVLYRQHGRNTLGARSLRGASGLFYLANLGAVKAGLARSITQAEVFLHRYGDRLDAEAAGVVGAFADLGSLGWLGRRLAVARHGFWKSSLLKNIGILALI